MHDFRTALHTPNFASERFARWFGSDRRNCHHNDQLPVALSNSIEHWIELSPYRLPMYRGSGTLVLNFLIIGAHIQSRLGLYLAKYSTGLSKFCFFSYIARR
jgi:hypothetical protein